MRWGPTSKSKFGNRKVHVGGETFDSEFEYKRWRELCILQAAGQITDLQRQVKFVLIPQQREPDTIGPRGGVHQGKVIEQECAYVADFVYRDDTGETVVEDAKGFRTDDYVIKRKLMLWVHGIRVQEIRER